LKSSWIASLPQLTREGKFFIGISLGVGFAAVKTGNNLLFLVFGLLLSLLTISVILSEVTLRSLNVSRLIPQNVFVGRSFLIKIKLQNQKVRFPSFSIEVEDILDSERIDKKCYFLKIPAKKTQETAYKLQFKRRGRYSFRGFRVATKFPFALYRAWRVVEFPAEILVFPRIREVGSLAGIGKRQGEGIADRVAGRGESLLGLREFREGDDLRDIHWKATARAGRMIVKEYDATATKHVHLLFDSALPTNDDTAREEMESAIEIVASLGQHYLSRGYSVELTTRSGHVQVGGGQQQLGRILTHLALLELAPPSAQPMRVHHAAGPSSFLIIHRQAQSRPRGGFAQIAEVGGALTEVRRSAKETGASA
jgi:uncharacterized protein (DUF58 family)